VEEIDEPPPARLAFEGRAVELLDLLPTFQGLCPNEFTLCGVRCTRDRTCDHRYRNPAYSRHTLDTEKRWQELMALLRKRWVKQFLRDSPGDWIKRLQKRGALGYGW
jgi:hypothetical protein